MYDSGCVIILSFVVMDATILYYKYLNYVESSTVTNVYYPMNQSSNYFCLKLEAGSEATSFYNVVEAEKLDVMLFFVIRVMLIEMGNNSMDLHRPINRCILCLCIGRTSKQSLCNQKVIF